MIPNFGPTGKLKRGEHGASWDEVVQRLGFSPRRKLLLQGLLAAAQQLAAAGVKTLYIDGSFATSKRNPGDFDCCYEVAGIDFDSLPAVFQTFDNGRELQKQTFGGELFPAEWIANEHTIPPEPYRTFFQHDHANRPKGIVALDLGTLP